MVDPFSSDNPFSIPLKAHFEEQARLSMVAWHKQELKRLCPDAADPVPSIEWLNTALINLQDAPTFLDAAEKLRERMIERLKP
jgi:hypothetical protein